MKPFSYIYGAIVTMSNPFSKIIQRVFGKTKMPAVDSLPDTDPPLHTGLEYAALITTYIPYFHWLLDEEKKRFIRRTWQFRQCKTFHFVGMEAKEEIPVLISAAAVQLTFGLSRYKLEFFKDIFIMPDAYQFENDKQLYIGHVSVKGIHISWKHFLQGYANASDNINVAIHEMAHALEHNNFMEDAGVDAEFKTDFEKLSPVYGPALASSIVQRRSCLRPYAYLNLQEFWAVGVEAFFENPGALRHNMPRLYDVICEILNQDPAALTRVGKTA